MKRDDNINPTVIDLYSGAGGSGLGFLEAGYQILSAIEIDPFSSMTYEKNLGANVIVGDIRELSPSDLREELELQKSDLDVLVGCPPCQGFSRMRNENGRNDHRNDLVLVYLDYVNEFLPRFAVFENVPGIIRTAHGKKYYNRLVNGLKELGYALEERLEDAADYGVAQHRKRIIVIGGRDYITPPFPRKTHGWVNSTKVKNGCLKPWKTVEEEIGNDKYPPLEAGENGEMEGAFPNHIAPRTGEKVMKFIKNVPKNGGSRTDVPEKLWLPCHKSHKGHLDVYGRLAWDKPANTITTGCTNISKGRFVHPEQDRALTYREAAALQGFPDEFIFYEYNISTQIGNAVPPPLAYAIASELRENLIQPNSDNN